MHTHTAPLALAIARQPILNATREVYGYELFDRSVLQHRHTASSDAQLLFNVLSLSNNQALVGSKTIFLNCTHDSLAGGHLDLVTPEHVVLEIPALAVSQLAEIETRLPSLQTMRQRGFRLAFDHLVLTRPYGAWLPLASFVKLNIQALQPESLETFVKLAKNHPHVQLIAEKVETTEQYNLVCKLGFSLFQGYWFAEPVLIEGRTIRPAQAAILQLINLVRKQASTNEIEAVFKHDPTLSFNLLRFINSASFGMRSEVTSFKHAVMLLGLKRLFKWAALLMTTSNAGDTPAAVGLTAVVRGRLMELLATQALSPEECDNAFVVGIFSLLDTMLGMPMAHALEVLNLPTSVTQALLQRSGPLWPYLQLALACEVGDDESFAQAVRTLGLDGNLVNLSHLDALSWAENLGKQTD